METEIVKIGVVGVDTGQLMLCDPSYMGDIQDTDLSGGGQIDFKLGHAGLAVLFPSGFGDDTYEVFAEYMKLPDDLGGGRRVKKVWVELITDKHIERARAILKSVSSIA